MQRQKPGLGSEKNSVANKVNPHRQVSGRLPASNWVKGFISHLSIQQKIGFGYALAIGIAVLGANAGQQIGRYYEQQARQKYDLANEEEHLLTEMQIAVLQARSHQQQFIPLIGNPKYQEEHAHFRKHIEQIDQVFSEIKSYIDKNSKADPDIALVEKWLKTYEDTPEVYSQQMEAILKRIDPDNLQPKGVPQAQQLLLEFTNSEVALKFDGLSDDLTDLVEAAHEEELEAQEAVHRAESLHLVIVNASLFSSILVAIALSLYLSRAIARPIQSVTKVAHRVTDEADFTLQAPVTTKDEIGTLALAFNKLIQRVAEYTQELEITRATLEDRVEERTAELNTQKEFLNALLNNLADGIVACDANGILTLFNRATQEIHGLPAKPIPPEEWAQHFDLYLADGKTQVPITEIPLLRAFEGEVIDNVEMVIAPKQGKARTVLASGQPIIDAQGNKLGAVVALRDITASQEIQAALRQSESRLHSTLNSLKDVVWSIALDSLQVFYMNPAAENLYQRPVREFLDNPYLWMKLIHPEDLAQVQASTEKVLKWGSYEMDYRIIRLSGEVRWVHSRCWLIYDEQGTAIRMDGMLSDITERKQAEDELKQTLHQLTQTQAQLIQTEKMSSLGQMVAGIAHEINNPVNFIHGNVNHLNNYFKDLLELVHLYQQEYPQENPQIQEQIEEIDLNFLCEDLPKTISSMKMGTDRIREIVLSLRNFSRLDESAMKPVDIHEGINSTLLILNHRIKQGIEVIKEYGNLPLVECYPAQLNQVFMNIVNNAIDALLEEKDNTPKDFQPKIFIRTEVVEKSDKKSVQVKIKDNGTGIPPEIIGKLFDPFFTTKPVGQGTGLGLAICYQIIEKHGGKIEIFSEPEQGTEFAIALPLKL